jgi:hypothetical protein
MSDQKEQIVSRSELVEILIRENGCDEDSAQMQASLAGTKGLVVKGIRYVVGK